MLTCNDANALIVRTLDDARLSGGERAALRWHLAACARCRLEYETQHEVRRLLVLHIQDPLPAGFDERLNARLAQTARSLPGGVVADTAVTRAMPAPAPSVDPRWLDVGDSWHGGMHGRTWALRIGPLAAALLLFAVSASVYDAETPPESLSSSPRSSVGGTASEAPRTFTTMVLPRSDRASRRQRTPSVSSGADDLARAPRQPLDDGQWQGSGVAVVESGTAAAAQASRATQDVPAPSATVDRIPTLDPRPRQGERVASRAEVAGAAAADTDADADGNDEGAERATSQRPGILPRPVTPFPHARPAMPAPPAVLLDRTIPPW